MFRHGVTYVNFDTLDKSFFGFGESASAPTICFSLMSSSGTNLLVIYF